MAYVIKNSIFTAGFVILFMVGFYGNLISADNEDQLVFQAGDQPTQKFGTAESVRYLLYDVNPGEGFNLRRDVYMRVANLVKFLNDDAPWVLVLPPWGRLYHWQSRDIEMQVKIPWSLFFDLESLRLHVPVMEFEDYIKVRGRPEVDEVYYLQRFKEGWTHWEEKMKITDCVDPPRYQKNAEGQWEGTFFGYEEFYAKKFECMSAQAYAVTMKDFLLKNTTANSIFLDRAETLIHGQYSEWSPEYWTARRSMVFAKHLRDIGDKFRAEKLDSNDEKDNTVLDVWTDMKRKHGEAKGGPYLAVHLRRKDYLYAHKNEVPNLKKASNQIKKILKKYKLKKLFVATDAPQSEFETLKEYFKKTEVFKFQPSHEIHEKYKDGGVAIIDQWICAHARVFVGSYVSTFTFRIHEEREILGFDPEATYNRFCGDKEEAECEQPTKWEIKY